MSSDFNDGKKAGIEIGRVIGHDRGFKEGYEVGKQDGRCEGVEAAEAAQPTLDSYSLEEYFDCIYHIDYTSTVEKMVIGLKEQIGESSLDLEDLKNALEYHFGDKLK